MNTNPFPDIVRRRVDIDFGSGQDKSRTASIVGLGTTAMAFSLMIPAAERFFIKSAQHFQDRISDPGLKAQLNGFIYQEAMHTKEHQRLNKIVCETYPHTNRIAALGEIPLSLAEKYLPPVVQLAVTSAMEHLTALWSDMLLRRQEEFIREADPAYAQLYLWHAVEETEHKAVCFDIYQQVTGGGLAAYCLRILAMLITTLIELGAVLIGAGILKLDLMRNSIGRQTSLGQVDGMPRLRKPKRLRWFNLAHFLIDPAMLKFYFSYYKWGFHPWDHDNSQLVEAWKQRFPDFGTKPLT